MQNHYDYLVVGAGISSAVFVHEALAAGKSCLVIDRRDHIAGNVYCKEEEGINVHVYGAHIFHTSIRRVWDYVNRFAEFNNYVNSPIAYYKGETYNMPFNMNTFSKMSRPTSERACSSRFCGSPMFSAAICSAILALASAGVTTPHILLNVFMLNGML